jgi:hypothetical protein
VNRRSWTLAAVVLGLALLLAFPLRPTVERTVIVPAAYVLWLAGLLYNSMPQVIWWAAALILVAVIAVGAMIPKPIHVRRKIPALPPPQGQVEDLARWIKKTEAGIYYKWLVAHRLGKLAHQMLTQREAGRPRALFSPLSGPDWQPGTALREYLEIGLHGSFADYPGSAKTRRSARRTPLDLDIAEAIEFLESKAETNRDRHF